ncbi:acyl-coenzyme A thioesterase 13-like [Oppia nitens]|uniref:acyl-coenzyme A thioesterase 13-like n=1 Tax=Oppia nitens TaxID=1686743 RepID=UPI0023DB2546|nr:acyl-coenzyme A thioesterase 13-like [Oppia nitens]XP_054153535.1 acyl-coenzyme A thioesterase 13-like [Oppia nitens]
MSHKITTLMRNTLKRLVESNKFDNVLNQVNITDAFKGRLIAEMLVTKEATNWSNHLHGGMTATIVDQLSSLALTTAFIDENDIKDETFYKARSVSLDLSITYLTSVQLGQTIVIEANTLKCGKNIAFLSVDIFNKDSKQLIAKGSHTKYLLNN